MLRDDEITNVLNDLDAALAVLRRAVDGNDWGEVEEAEEVLVEAVGGLRDLRGTLNGGLALTEVQADRVARAFGMAGWQLAENWRLTVDTKILPLVEGGVK